MLSGHIKAVLVNSTMPKVLPFCQSLEDFIIKRYFVCCADIYVFNIYIILVKQKAFLRQLQVLKLNFGKVVSSCVKLSGVCTNHTLPELHKLHHLKTDM